MPAKQEKATDGWMAWFQKLGKAVVEMCAPTDHGKTPGKAGAKATGANVVTGHSIIHAEDLS